MGLRDANGQQNGRRLQWSFDAPVPSPNLAIRFIAALQVSIDIQPGDGNSINPDKKGSIPAAILTTSALDARTVQVSTVRFGRLGTEATPTQSALADVDRDGDIDLVLHFRAEDTGIRCGDNMALVTGRTKTGLAIKGADAITTVSCK